MIGSLVKRFGDRYLSPVNTRWARHGVTKARVNLLELLAGCASGLAFAIPSATVGWILLLMHGFLDYFDGGTRRTGLRMQEERRLFGMDTHIVVDKVSETALFCGLLAGGLVPAWLALTALGTSLLVTVFGRCLLRRGCPSLEHTLFDRADRIIGILVIGLLVNYPVALIAVCVMNGITILQRILELGKSIPAGQG